MTTNREASILVRIDNMDTLKTEATYSVRVRNVETDGMTPEQMVERFLDEAPAAEEWTLT